MLPNSLYSIIQSLYTILSELLTVSLNKLNKLPKTQRGSTHISRSNETTP
jgi:hypothetical protein